VIWPYVIHMGDSLEDGDVDDVTWWRTIEFAFQILARLGLAMPEPPPEDEREMEKMGQKLKATGKT
jgi:hypothetical protein